MPRDRDDDRYDDEDDRPRRRSRRDDFDDEDDRPRRRRSSAPPTSAGKTLLIVFGILAAVLLVCGGVSFALLWPAVKKVREAADRQRSTNDVKVLGIASLNFNDATGKLPLPFVPRTGEQPGAVPADLPDRLSWRVALLPYLQQGSLYNRFKPDEPWNSPSNQPLAAVVVRGYADADDAADPTTRYRCFYDNGAAFDTRRPARIPAAFTDGTANTILYVEGADKVTWSRFGEYRFDPAGALPPLGHPKRDVFAAVMADASVRWVRKSVSPATLKAAVTANGGEILGPDW
jgi:hypothetical protein